MRIEGAFALDFIFSDTIQTHPIILRPFLWQTSKFTPTVAKPLSKE